MLKTIKVGDCRNVAEMWESFSTSILPESVLANKTGVQYTEMQRAYYSGVLSLLLWLLTNVTEDPADEESESKKLEALFFEAQEFLTGLGDHTRSRH